MVYKSYPRCNGNAETSETITITWGLPNMHTQVCLQIFLVTQRPFEKSQIKENS
jgi:hypothetical protein